MSKREILSKTYAPTFSYNKLSEKFKTKWIEALKSEKYKQGRTSIAKEIDGEFLFDPLGIAARVCEIGAENLLGRKDLIAIKDTKVTKAERKWNALLSKRVPLELRTNKPLNSHLINLSDTYGFSFISIAAWIKKYL